MPGWGIASDGREVSIVQRRRLLEMDVIGGVIMGSAQNMEWWSLWKTRTSLGGQVTYRDIFAILLYRVIGRIRTMTLHLGVLNEESDTGGRTWDRVCGMLAKIRCPQVYG